MTDLVERATETAADTLSVALPRRWSHVQGVAAKAATIAHILEPEDRDALIAAAWLHDVGYAPGIADTGLHALDGARWLVASGYPIRIAALVAYHSCAIEEAAERNLSVPLTREFNDEASATTDALWYSDMTTSPDGEPVDVVQRLAEVNERYGPDHVVTRFWLRGRAPLLAAVQRVEDRLGAQPM